MLKCPQKELRKAVGRDTPARPVECAPDQLRGRVKEVLGPKGFRICLAIHKYSVPRLRGRADEVQRAPQPLHFLQRRYASGCRLAEQGVHTHKAAFIESAYTCEATRALASACAFRET